MGLQEGVGRAQATARASRGGGSAAQAAASACCRGGLTRHAAALHVLVLQAAASVALQPCQGLFHARQGPLCAAALAVRGGVGGGQAPRAALRLRSVLRGVQGHQLGAKGAAPAQLRRVCACQGAVAGDKLRPAQAQARASKARAELQGAAPRAPRPPAAQLAPPVRHVSAARGAAAARAPPSTVSAPAEAALEV